MSVYIHVYVWGCVRVLFICEVYVHVCVCVHVHPVLSAERAQKNDKPEAMRSHAVCRHCLLNTTPHKGNRDPWKMPDSRHGTQKRQDNSTHLIPESN